MRSAEPTADEPNLAAWCRFLSAETDEELEALAMQDPILRDAKLALERLTADPQLRQQAERLEEEIKLYQFGTRKLREEGRVEGRTEGQAVMLSRLLTLKFGELTPEVRARIVGAPQVELERWADRVLAATSLDEVFAS